MTGSASYDVFLCHSSEDKPQVRELARVLREESLRVFLDADDLVPGQPWMEGLEAAIEKSRAALILYGPSGLAPWAIREMRAFIDEFVRRGVAVIPVLMLGAPDRPELPIFLRQFHWVDLREGSTGGLERLLAGIRAALPHLGRDAGRPLESPGAAPRKSPYVVGPPIEREQDFFGRVRETERILEAIEKGQAVQILGGASHGKSSLLRWVERKAPGDRPVARLEPGAGLTPVMLVKGIAEKLGNTEVAARLDRKGATVNDAAEQLRRLGSMVLLIDDADKLPEVGEGYTEGFFEVVRGRVEERAIVWVSASRRDLYGQFKEKGLSSRFFTGSEKLWVGPLDAAEARRLAALGGSGHDERILEEAGRFGYGLQWLGNRLAQGDAVDDACIRFRTAMEPIFTSWWQGLKPGEQTLLKQYATGERAPEQQDEARRQQLLILADAGHLERVGSHYRWVGNAWKDFVRNVG